MTQHSVLSASKADRWATCPGSIAMCEGREGGGTSAAAREGTGLHALLDEAVKGKVELSSMVGKTYQFVDHGEQCSMELTAEQVEAVGEVFDMVEALPGQLFADTRVCYGRAIGQPDEIAFGTLDIAKLDGSHLHVLDAKFGRKYVSEVENKQMLLYAIGMVDTLEMLGDPVETITLHIGQPRAGSKRQGWEISRFDLDSYIDLFNEQSAKVEAATASFDPEDRAWRDEYLSPSEEACRWCPVKAHCQAFHDVINDMGDEAIAVAGEDEFDKPKLTDVPAATLAHFLARAEMVKMFIEACEKEAKLRFSFDPHAVPGYKMVAGRSGNRKWIDTQQVAEALRAVGCQDDMIFAPKTLNSPATIERALRTLMSRQEAVDLVDSQVTRAEPKPALVTLDHPGEPIMTGVTENDFEVLS